MEDKEIKALISLLDDEDPVVYTMILEKISELGTDIIPYLENEWESNFNPLVQRRIEDITHDLQFRLVKQRLQDWILGDQNDLLEGLWIISSYQYPDLDKSSIQREMDDIYHDVWLNFKQDLHPYDQVKILNSLLFINHKFSSNLKNFHSPSNSFINCVLESRKGNPITLCIVYMMIAQKLKLPIYGVNLPNLFVLTYKDSKFDPFYINVYNKGALFTRPDIENYIKELKMEPIPSFFEPCTNGDIVRRILRNLIVSYEKAGEKAKKEEIQSLLEIASGDEDLPQL